MAMTEYKFVSKDNLLYFWLKIKLLLTNKVDKVEGKGLSTNDLTDELKQKILNAGDSTFTGVYSDLTGKPSINNVELGTLDSDLSDIDKTLISDKLDLPELDDVNNDLSGSIPKKKSTGVVIFIIILLVLLALFTFFLYNYVF